ncbi:MAG: hypothetical protein U0744_07805 [Gemmataceae bacterium]
MQKKVVREHRVPGNPINCQRLYNGNTFIGCYNMLIEVTPGEKSSTNTRPGAASPSQRRAQETDGTIVCMMVRAWCRKWIRRTATSRNRSGSPRNLADGKRIRFLCATANIFAATMASN